jgi:hypothetical protein
MKVSFQKRGNTNALKTIGGSEFLLQPKESFWWTANLVSESTTNFSSILTQ